MPDPTLVAIAAVMLVPAILMFLQRKLIRAVMCLAIAAVGGALLLLYLGQDLAALLQLFVFVGCLPLYLMMSAAPENWQVTVRDAIKLLVADVVIGGGICLPFALSGGGGTQLAGNDFTAAVASSLGGQYALAYAAVFLAFASAIGAAIVIRRFSKVAV